MRKKIGSGYGFKLNRMRNAFIHDPIRPYPPDCRNETPHRRGGKPAGRNHGKIEQISKWVGLSGSSIMIKNDANAPPATVFY